MSDEIFVLCEKKTIQEDSCNKDCKHEGCWHTKLKKINVKEHLKEKNNATKKLADVESMCTPFEGLEKHKLYYVDNNSLSDVECDHIIEKFEKDLRKKKGITSSKAVNLLVKDTLDLLITGYVDWLDVDRLLYKKLTSAMKEFQDNCDVRIIELNPLFSSTYLVTDGFQVQKYEKGTGKYIWHSDHTAKYRETHDGKILPFHRVYTFIWYLNDIEVGGETLFLHDKIKPKKGKLLLFPSSWDNYHCANYSPNTSKYIITGWISCNMVDDLKGGNFL